MPIYEIGYRHWDGRRTHPWLRWWCITRTGIRLAFRNWVLRKLFYFVYAPLFYVGPAFIAIGAVTDPQQGVDLNGIWQEFNEEFFGRAVARALIEDPMSARPAAWAVVFYIFFTFQMFTTLVVVAFVGPPLLSRDIKSKGYLVYFAKPVTVGEYLLGKGGVIVSFVFLVTLAPALLLYGISIGYSPTIGAFLDTWHVPLRILAASVTLAVPTALVVLMLSAIVPEVRYAAFAWIAVCIFGEVAFQMMSATPGLRDASWTFLVSPREIMATAWGAIFDAHAQLDTLGDPRKLRWLHQMIREQNSAPLAFGAIVTVSVVCIYGLRQRISGLMRL